MFDLGGPLFGCILVIAGCIGLANCDGSLTCTGSSYGSIAYGLYLLYNAMVAAKTSSTKGESAPIQKSYAGAPGGPKKVQ
jgi:hypothetical protein